MARVSVKNRNLKREKLISKMREKRDKLRDAVRSTSLSDKERWEATLELQGLPRDSSPTRFRNRCKYESCGRQRAYNRRTGLCRMHMRIAVLGGMVPGMRKSSW